MIAERQEQTPAGAETVRQQETDSVTLSPCHLVTLSPCHPQSPAPRRRELTPEEYYAGVRAGDLAVLARALTLIESSNPRHQPLAEALLTRLLPHTGQSIRVGITGAPGVGKSTFIEALGLQLVRRGLRVAVLAVDPSSRISGGSILGDKTRMPRLAAEPGAYIRPSPSAGTLGGVSRKTRESMLVCEAAGYHVVLVETVGVGQSETAVADMTDCFVALMLPGAGDELQGIKRGLLELIDVVVVNKADGATRTPAELAAEQYRLALQSLAGRQEDLTAVLTCSALHQQGVDAVWEAVQRRHALLTASGELAERRQRQNLHWLWALVEDGVRQALQTHPAVREVRDDLERAVEAGQTPAAVAARRILAAFGIKQA
jgi:LAO/AO transport system kinase